MAGRKAKPVHLHVVQGTGRKDRHNLNGPKPVTALPNPPDWLPQGAKVFFLIVRKRLEELGYASESHTEMLTVLSIALDEIEECTKVIESDGFTMLSDTSTGGTVIKTRPEVTIRHNALRRAQSVLAEFGLSPSSIGRIGLQGGKPEKDPWDDL